MEAHVQALGTLRSSSPQTLPKAQPTQMVPAHSPCKKGICGPMPRLLLTSTPLSFALATKLHKSQLTRSLL
ncbi:unnamed protein product [Prunus armeniaca]